MADNVAITAGSGTSIATDDVSSVHYQVVKLDAGGNGAALPISDGGTNALPVAGFQSTVSVTVTRPADTTQYAQNDCLSDSTSAPTTFTITGAGRASGKSGVILDMVVISDNDPATVLQGEVFVFDSSVTSANDNAAFTLSDSDALKLVGIIPFTLEDIGANHAYHARYVNLPYTCVGSANLRFLVRAKNAYTPASAEVLTFRFKVAWTD